MKRPYLALIALLFILVGIFSYFNLPKSDLNCKDFFSQKEAQKAFLKNPKDIYRLDADRDGIACEGLR